MSTPVQPVWLVQLQIQLLHVSDPAWSCNINTLFPSTGRNSPKPLCFSLEGMTSSCWWCWISCFYGLFGPHSRTHTPLPSNNYRIYVTVLNYPPILHVSIHSHTFKDELFPPPAPLSFSWFHFYYHWNSQMSLFSHSPLPHCKFRSTSCCDSCGLRQTSGG